MTDFYREGERIAGDKIVYRFGKVSSHQRVLRVEGTLARNGEARVVRPLMRSATYQPRSSDAVHCKIARFQADAIEEGRAKVHVGSHRSFEGFLKGDAWCRIQVPFDNRQRP